MDKRKALDENANNAFSNDNSSTGLWGPVSEDERAAMKRGKSERIQVIPIDNISPDPYQPRRVVPSFIRSSRRPSDQLTEWARIAKISLDFAQELISGDVDTDELDGDPDETSDPISAGFYRILSLAASIYRDGLTNPITIVRNGERFNLETGERRWMAFHLLRMLRFDSYEAIPCRVVDTFDVWRQAAENNTRQNLNAVQKARQLAILIMEVYGKDQFAPIEAFEHEHDFYAQVSSGDQFPAPRGMAQRIVDAMGLSNPSQIRQYRAILRLPHQIWVQADDESWTERAIRDGGSVTTVTASQRIASKTAVHPPTLPGVGGQFQLFLSKNAAKYRKFIPKLQKGLSDKELASARRLLDEQIAELQKMRNEL